MVLLIPLLEAILSPIGIMLLAMFAGILLAVANRKSRWGLRLLSVGTLLYLFYLFSPLADLLVRNLESDYPSLVKTDSLPKIQRIVVLAGYGEHLRHIPAASFRALSCFCPAGVSMDGAQPWQPSWPSS